MFNQKVTNLYKSSKTEECSNIFEKEMFRTEHKVYSENGSIKLDTTGNIFVNDFQTLGKYKPNWVKDSRVGNRIQGHADYWHPNETFARMEEMWKVNPLLTLKEMMYLRTITRNTKHESVEYNVKGQGLKYEYICRLMWVATNHSNTFKKNLLLFINIGSWSDLFDLLELDLSYVHNGRAHALDWKFIIAFIANYLQDPEHCDLIKKYLPQIKSAKNCKTLHNQCTNYIAKSIAKALFTGKPEEMYASYRRLKASGTAHQWQQAISRKDFTNFNFDCIAGRALGKLVQSSFLENQGLEKAYEEWMESKPILKFTGYPYELFKNVDPCYNEDYSSHYPSLKNYQINTINKQFMGLVNNFKCPCKYIVAIDNSGSMTSIATGTGLSAAIVAKSMAVYFSYMLEGPFKDTYLEFESKTSIHKFHGTTPVEKFQTPIHRPCYSTDIVGIAKLFVELLKKGYKESDFPIGVIGISDSEFDGYYGKSSKNYSTFQTMKKILLEGGFSKEYVDNFTLVLWDVERGQSTKFEELSNIPNFFQFGGYDPAAISFLFTGEVKNIPAPKTSEELFEAAMNQEIFNRIVL